MSRSPISARPTPVPGRRSRRGTARETRRAGPPRTGLRQPGGTRAPSGAAGHARERPLFHGIPSGQERDRQLLAAQVACGRRLGDHRAVDVRQEGRHSWIPGKIPHRRDVQVLGGQRTQRSYRSCIHARRERRTTRMGLVERGQRPMLAIPEGAALAMALWINPVASGDARRMPMACAPADSPNTVTCGIAAETRDVGLDPAQRRLLVHQAVIARASSASALSAGGTGSPAPPTR